MLTQSTKILLDQNVVFTEMENGESVLLNLGTSEYFSLNETGTLIWHGLSSNLNLSDIGEELEKTFDVSKEQATQYVINLVDELVSEKLVSVKGE